MFRVVISSMDWILRSNLHPLQSLKADPYPMDLTYGQIHYRWIIQRFEVIRGCTPYFDKDSLLLRVALAPGAKAAREHPVCHLSRHQTTLRRVAKSILRIRVWVKVIYI
jgi:hypothetical protein